MNGLRFHASFLALVAASACAKTPEQDLTKAQAAQTKANERILEVQQAGAEKVSEAQDELAKSRAKLERANAEAAREAEQKSDQIKKEIAATKVDVAAKSMLVQNAADKTIREAGNDTAKMRSTLRAWGEDELAKLDTDIAAARTKAGEASAEVKADFERTMREIAIKRENVRGELAALDAQAADKFAAYESRLHTDIDDLKQRIAHVYDGR
ncbi:MAG: hypothetical protein RL385_3385 [Pseudomonadota bacterium]|jgi:thermostable 8-oxoguanine DNA glycosylase